MIDANTIYHLKIVDRLTALHEVISPYDLFINVANSHFIEIGRFSAGALGRIHFGAAVSKAEPILKVGDFCEFGRNCVLLLGGDHQNQSIFNYTFGPCPAFPALGNSVEFENCFKDRGATIIENNVLCSFGSMILGGSRIGSGSIIAAGAVAIGECKPFGVYAGVPADFVRNRFDLSRQTLHDKAQFHLVRAHETPKLFGLCKKLEDGDISIADFRSSISYIEKRPRVHLPATINMQGKLELGRPYGYSIDGTEIKDFATLNRLNSYFTLPWDGQDVFDWSPDIFHALGLS